MGLISVFLIAVSLAMDAFAVSVTNGVVASKISKFDGFKSSVYFGVFQFIMPLIGYFVGSKFEHLINAYDHWVVFLLLFAIGLNMIIEGIKNDKDEIVVVDDVLSRKKLFLQAIATSIDALAVGVSFAIANNKSILIDSLIIGIVALIFSYIGLMFGKKLGDYFKKGAEITGGVILVIIGIKALIQGLM